MPLRFRSIWFAVFRKPWNIISICHNPGAFPSMPSFEEFKAQGNRAFADKEYKRAAKIYRDALVQYGDNPVLYANRAQCFLHLKDWMRAYNDAKSGLECDPPAKIKTKLLFRQGIAAKELSRDQEAMQCFQSVLSIDAANKGALDELEKLRTEPKCKKLKSDYCCQIPTEFVSELPKEFAEIVAPPVVSVPKTSSTEYNPDLVESVSEELFGKRKTTQKESLGKSENLAPASNAFSLMPSMHFLSALKLVPPEKKVQSYNYVANLEDSVLSSLFETLGVDHEFFEFFLEAFTHIILHDKNPQSIDQLLHKLRLMSTFTRFSLSLTMCDDHLITNLISSIKEVSPAYLKQLSSILQGR